MSDPYELKEAQYESNRAWENYQEAVDDYYDHHYGDPIYWRKVTDAMKAADRADALVTKLAIKHGWRRDPADFDQKYQPTTF